MSGRKVAAAGIWSSFDVVLRQGIAFLVSVLLARLLAPGDFGIIALLGFFSSFSAIFIQGGLTTALVQQHGTSRDEESTIFWLNLGCAVLFGGLLLIAAPAIARFYGFPILRDLMPFAALQVVLTTFGAVQTALLSRSLRFDIIALAGVAASIVSGLVGVTAAFLGAGVWALVYQATLSAGINSLILWIKCDWRPNRHFRLRSIMPILRFAVYLSLSSLLEVVNSQGYALIIGKFHGPRVLGFLNRANNTQQFVTGILSAIISRIALPVFATPDQHADALRRKVQVAVRLSMMINVPAMVGLALLSGPVVVCLFGPKWLPSAPILTLFALGNIVTPLHVINLQLMLAQGRSDRFFLVEVVKKVFGLTGMIVGSLNGPIGFGYAVIIVGVISFAINAYYTGRTLGYGAWRQAQDVMGPALLSLAMVAAILLCRPFVHIGVFGTLLVLVAVGGITYIVAALAFVRLCWPDIFAGLRTLAGRADATAVLSDLQA